MLDIGLNCLLVCELCRFSSGSADSKLKFWDFDLVEADDEPSVTKRKRLKDPPSQRSVPKTQLALTHTRTLTMTDEVRAVDVPCLVS